MPAGTNVPEFWLADSTTASVRTIEELIITNSILAQALKGLFEGNPNTKANTKYRSYVKTTNSPLIVTMNGDSKENMCKYVSNELQAFINRAKVLFFSRPMPAVCRKYLPIMLRWGPQIMAVMARKFNLEANSTCSISPDLQSKLLAMDVEQMF